MSVPAAVERYIREHYPWPPTDCPEVIARWVADRLLNSDWVRPQQRAVNCGIFHLRDVPEPWRARRQQPITCERCEKQILLPLIHIRVHTSPDWRMHAYEHWFIGKCDRCACVFYGSSDIPGRTSIDGGPNVEGRISSILTASD